MKGDMIDIGYVSGQRSSSQAVIDFETPLSEHFYQDKDVLKRLKDEGFDLLFSDMVYIDYSQGNRRIQYFPLECPYPKRGCLYLLVYVFRDKYVSQNLRLRVQAIHDPTKCVQKMMTTKDGHLFP